MIWRLAPHVKPIEATLAAEAQAWCKMIISRNPTIVNRGPAARILSETTQQDCLLVRAVMYFQTWEWPQSGSGWGDYYFRVVEMTFVNDAKSAERVLDEHRIHVTEYEDESFDWQAALAEFSKPFEQEQRG